MPSISASGTPKLGQAMHVTCTGTVKSVTGVRGATLKLQSKTVYFAVDVALVRFNNNNNLPPHKNRILNSINRIKMFTQNKIQMLFFIFSG